MRRFSSRLREVVSSENLNPGTRDLFRKEVRALLLGSPPPEWGLRAMRKSRISCFALKIVIIQMKADEEYFPVVLFIILYKVVLTLSLWMKSKIVIIQMKATEQYFPVVVLIMPYKVVLAFESVDEILKCDHSNESD